MGIYDVDTERAKTVGWEAGAPDMSFESLLLVIDALIIAAPADAQFRNPVHCAHISADGFVYVCDRTNDRVQVFTKQGKFVREFFVHKSTLGIGSVWNLSFSYDKEQKYLLVADGEDNVIWIVRRADDSVVSSFGHNGRNAGQFHWVHQSAMDSQGNYYTGEVDTGKRVQKFTLGHDH